MCLATYCISPYLISAMSPDMIKHYDQWNRLLTPLSGSKWTTRWLGTVKNYAEHAYVSPVEKYQRSRHKRPLVCLYHNTFLTPNLLPRTPKANYEAIIYFGRSRILDCNIKTSMKKHKCCSKTQERHLIPCVPSPSSPTTPKTC